MALSTPIESYTHCLHALSVSSSVHRQLCNSSFTFPTARFPSLTVRRRGCKGQPKAWVTPGLGGRLGLDHVHHSLLRRKFSHNVYVLPQGGVAVRVSAVGCQAAGREAETVAEAEEHVGDPGGVAEQGVTEEDVTEEGEGGKAKEWEPAADAYSVLASFQLREATRAGEIVVKAMRPEHVKSTAELLTESFADLFGVFTVKALLRLQVLVYLQQRLMLVPHGVTLVGLRYNEESKKDEVVATAELSFSSKSRVPFSTLDPPPEAAYLCNMAVLATHRRKRLGTVVIKAAEELCRQMGSTSLCLHCRLIDKAPNVLYKSAGFEFVEEDTLLGAALTFQRRRALLRKYISRRADAVEEEQQVAPLGEPSSSSIPL